MASPPGAPKAQLSQGHATGRGSEGTGCQEKWKEDVSTEAPHPSPEVPTQFLPS